MTCRPCHKCGFWLTGKSGANELDLGDGGCSNCGAGQYAGDSFVTRGIKLSFCASGLLGAGLARGIFNANNADFTPFEGMMRVMAEFHEHPFIFTIVVVLLTVLLAKCSAFWFAKEAEAIGAPEEEITTISVAGDQAREPDLTPVEFGIGMAILFLILMGAAAWLDWFTPLIFLPFMSGAIGFALFARAYRFFKKTARDSPAKSGAPLSLNRLEKLAHMKLADLEERRLGLEALKTRLESEPGGESDDLIGKVGQAAAMMERMQALCYVRLGEIEYSRWSNQFVPIKMDRGNLVSSDCNQRLSQLQTLKEQGETLLENLRQRKSLTDIHDGQRLINRLIEDLNGPCDHLKKRLFVQQAMLLMKTGDPLEDVFQAVPLNLNVEKRTNDDDIAMTEFWADYQALESEFICLQLGGEIRENLNRQDLNAGSGVREVDSGEPAL